MNFETLIENILNAQVKAWNQGDFANLENYFSENIIHSSPNVLRVYPERNSTELNGRSEMFDYLKKLSLAQPFKIEILEIVKRGRHSQAIMQFVEREQKMQVDYEINEYGKVTKLTLTRLN